MTLKDVKRILLESDMTMTALARHLNCSTAAIYLLLSTAGECPRLSTRLTAWMKVHR